jgi:hypothetical protein
MKNGGSAFPELTWERVSTGEIAHFASQGMTLRDWFAGQALAIFPRINETDELEGANERRLDIAKFTYAMADAMLAAREDK